MIKQNLHLEIIRCFISNAENTKGVNGKTALHHAIESNDLALVDLLFSKKNINPLVKDSVGKAPLDYAQEENKAEVLQALINHKYGPDQDSLLHLAAEVGEVSAVRYLISKGVNVDVRNTLNHTPLHLAAGAGHVGVIKILMTEGKASPDVFDGRNQAPIHYAVNNKQLEAIELLRELGADVNIASTEENSTQLSPLHIAVSNSSYDEIDLCLDIVKCLINTPECKINPQDYENQTPLHYAVDGNGLNTTDVLLTRKDIDPLMMDDNDKTPFEYALDENKSEIVKALMNNKYGAEKNSLLHLAAEKGLLNIVDTLINNGEDVNVVNDKSQSPIDLAAEKGHLNVVKLLLERGASPVVALCCAIRVNNLESLKVLLIRKDVDLFCRDNEAIDQAKENPVMFHVLNQCKEIIGRKNSYNKKIKICTVLTLAAISSITVILTIVVGIYMIIVGVFTAVTIIALNHLIKRSIDNNYQQKVLKVISEVEKIETTTKVVNQDSTDDIEIQNLQQLDLVVV